jgi:GNAT superfamily N-acetyltransferase
MEWSPWLAGVFVAPDYHRQGIGIQLVRRIVQDAARLACVGFTFTLQAWSSFIPGTAGWLSNTPTTGEQMLS